MRAIRTRKTFLTILILLSFFVLTGFIQNVSTCAAQETKRSVVASRGVVAAAHPLAAKAGLDVLKKGGNAFDAALATAFTLNVVEPNANGIGGGGFMILYSAKDKKTTVIDFREMAPAKAAPDFYKLDEKGNAIGGATETGYFAVGVPGQLRGMEMLHKKYATMKWADLMQPAIKYAEEGIPVSKTLNSLVKGELDRVQKFPGKAFYEKTYMKDGLPLEPGQTFSNKELAATLRKIAKGGPDVFYKGEIANAIEKEFKKPGADGWLTKKDLAAYKAVIRQPVKGDYRGYTIMSRAAAVFRRCDRHRDAEPAPGIRRGEDGSRFGRLPPSCHPDPAARLRGPRQVPRGPGVQAGASEGAFEQEVRRLHPVEDRDRPGPRPGTARRSGQV